MNKPFNPHFNIKLRKISGYFYLLTAISILICLFFVSKFLYEKFYLSITQAREVIVLKEKIAPETIDLNAFDDIIKNIKIKTEKRKLEISSIPFE